MPPCCLLSHRELLGQHLPPRVPDGAGTHCGHRRLASGSEMTPVQGCAWDTSLPRGEQLFLHPIPQGSTTPVQAKLYSFSLPPADSPSFQPTRTREGVLLAASGTPQALPDTPGWLLRVLQGCQTSSRPRLRSLWEIGHSSRAEVLMIPPSKHVPSNGEHPGRTLTPLFPALQGESRWEQSRQPPRLCRVPPTAPAAARGHITELFMDSLACPGCAHPCVFVTNAVLTLSRAQTNKP